jgi:hypothetical protein
VAGMRFTDPRVQALLATLCVFRLLPRGFTNHDLRHHLEPLLGRDPTAITSGQGTYDLRRLRHHRFIERVPHSHRYRVTDTGHRHALLLSRTHNRLLRDGLPTHSPPHTQPTKDPCRQPHLQNRTRPPPHPGRTRRQTSNPNLTQPERQTRPKLASRFRLCWGG